MNKVNEEPKQFYQISFLSNRSCLASSQHSPSDPLLRSLILLLFSFFSFPTFFPSTQKSEPLSVFFSPLLLLRHSFSYITSQFFWKKSSQDHPPPSLLFPCPLYQKLFSSKQPFLYFILFFSKPPSFSMQKLFETPTRTLS